MLAITPKTRVCGIIGKPLGHSLSPAIHNASFQEKNLDFVYLAFEVDDPGPAVQGMRALKIRGLSVTIPHKTAVIPFLDEIEGVARKIGAVNTIINDQGRLTGYNTDGTAALRALREAGIETREKSVLVLGSGGAARALTFNLAMKSPPASLKILGVIPDELKNLVQDLREKTGVKVSGDPLEESTLNRFLPESEILLQTTPVGMHPHLDQTLIPDRLLHSRLQVFEVIYNPRETRLLREAGARGLTVASGLAMFVYQAAAQFKMFTGEEAPRALMRKIVLESLTQNK